MKISVVTRASEPGSVVFDEDTIGILERLWDGWNLFTPDDEVCLLGSMSRADAMEAAVLHLGQRLVHELAN